MSSRNKPAELAAIGKAVLCPGSGKDVWRLGARAAGGHCRGRGEGGSGLNIQPRAAQTGSSRESGPPCSDTTSRKVIVCVGFYPYVVFIVLAVIVNTVRYLLFILKNLSVSKSSPVPRSASTLPVRLETNVRRGFTLENTAGVIWGGGGV